MIELDTEDDFNDFIRENRIALIDFFAEWCGPCKKIAPYLEQLSEEYKNVAFGKVNCDATPELCSEYSIKSLPTFLFFVDGKIVNTVIGAKREEIYKFLSKL
jgi:thioredoxin 1